RTRRASGHADSTMDLRTCTSVDLTPDALPRDVATTSIPGRMLYVPHGSLAVRTRPPWQPRGGTEHAPPALVATSLGECGRPCHMIASCQPFDDDGFWSTRSGSGPASGRPERHLHKSAHDCSAAVVVVVVKPHRFDVLRRQEWA